MNTLRLYKNPLSLLFIVMIMSFSAWAVEGDFPQPMNPPRLVNDFAGMLVNSQRDLLEEQLLEYEKSSSTQITIVTVNSLNGYEVADYTVTLFNQWNPGQKGKDNGVMLLISKEDKKINITTGYGLEGALPDAIAARIIRNEITPLFKQGDYFQGLSVGAKSIIEATRGEYNADDKHVDGVPISMGKLIMAFVFVIIIFWIITRGGGKGGGGYMSKRGYRRWTDSGPVIWGGGFGGGGFGGSSGGGFGGGGFGGFGGGSSGGGGASGGW